MKIFLTAFGLHNPFAIASLQEHNPIPLAIDAKGGLDLDYSTLLLAEGFIIDQSSLQFIADRQKRFLGPMHQSLQVLKNEGLLDVVDFGALCSPFRSQVEAKTIALVQDVHEWLPIARQQWQRLRGELEEFQERYGASDRAALDTTHYGVLNYLESRGGLDARESARLHGLLQSRRTKLTKREENELREILKPLIAQVLMNDLIRQQLKSPFVDWDDAQGFYDRLHLGQWPDVHEADLPASAMAVQARCLFNVVIPELLPERIEDVVAFVRNNKAVRSLRQELWQLLRDGGSVSAEWMLHLHDEAAKAEIRTERRNRVIKWVGRIANLLIPGAEIVKEVVVAGGEEIAEKVSGRHARSRFEWYYALQRMTIDSSEEDRDGTSSVQRFIG